MSYRNPEHYKKNKVSYPADDINPELKKNKDWFLALCEAMWSDFVCNQMSFNYMTDDGQRTIDELRAYATGKQDLNKIKGYLLKKINPDDPNSKFETKMNVSWQGYEVMPKMFDIIRSFNSKVDYEVNAVAIDDDSLDMKETDKEYIKFFLNTQVQDFAKKLQFTPQMKMNPQDVGAQTEADVDLLIDSGGFNLQHEIEAQVVTTKTKKESYFSVLQDQCFDDLAAIGRAGLREYVNKATNTPMIDWIDIKYAVVPPSDYLDYRDTTRRGIVRFMTLGQVKDETDLTEAQILQLAKDYAWLNPEYNQLVTMPGMGYFNPRARENYYSQYGVDPINDVRIMVLDMQALSVDINKFLDSPGDASRSGIYKPVGWEYKINKKDAANGDTIDEKQIIKKYEAKWIIGTQYFLNYGPSEYVKYKGEKGDRTPTIDFHFVQTKNSSLVERCISHIDDINLALIKRRNAIATLPPAPRMVIEQGLLDNVELAGILQEPEDLIKNFEERGILIVNRIDEFGKPVAVSGKTIEFVPSGIIEDITMFTNEIIQGKEAIKDVTGVNDITAAESPESRTGLGVNKLAQVASSNALYPTFNAFKYLFEPTFEGIVGKWQLVAGKDGDRKIAHVPVGTNTTQVFKISKNFASSTYNLRLDMVIGEDEKMRLLQEITSLKDARRQNGGNGGITGAQYLKIYDLIMSGNRKLAMFVLAQIEKMQQERDLAITQANQQATFQGQSQATQDAETAKQKTYQIEGSVKSNTILLTEAAKRKTMLVEALVNSIPGQGEPVNTSLIQQQLDECNQEIQLLSQIIHQDAMPTPPQLPPGAQQPGQPPQQQLQQAS